MILYYRERRFGSFMDATGVLAAQKAIRLNKALPRSRNVSLMEWNMIAREEFFAESFYEPSPRRL